MKYIYRKLLLVLSIGTFLIVAPSVVLYSMGYRLSLLEERPQAVGVLLVETIPENVHMDVNGKYIGRTPRAVPNLLPGSVNVKLSETGYADWQKTLPIHSGMATNLTAVRLFPQNPETTVLAANVDSFTLSPNQNIFAIIEKGNVIRLMDYQGEAVMPPRALKSSPVDVLWSSDSSMLAVQYNDATFAILDVARPASSLQSVSTITQAKKLVWDPRIPGRLLVLTQDDRLLAYSTASGQIELITKDVATFAVGSRNIYLVDTNDKIKFFSLEGELSQILPTELTNEAKALLISQKNDVAIQFVSGAIGILDDNNDLEMIVSNSVEADWSQDGTILFIQTANNELSVYNRSNERMTYMPQNKMQLITRLSRHITHPKWFDNNHIVYQAGNEVYITEIDTRDHALSYKLADAGVTDALTAVGEEGAVLYHIKELKNGTIDLIETSLVVE